MFSDYKTHGIDQMTRNQDAGVQPGVDDQKPGRDGNSSDGSDDADPSLVPSIESWTDVYRSVPFTVVTTIIDLTVV